MTTLRRASFLSIPLALAATFLMGCDPNSVQADETPQGDLFRDVDELVAVLRPTKGSSVSGIIKFSRKGEKVRVHGRVEGLEPGSQHGFHIHQWGDVSDEAGKAAGSHYNPADVEHALPGETPRHAGDLGNILANGEGVAIVDETTELFTLTGPKAPILGRALIVHAEADTGDPPSGEAGDRIAQGVIGIANADE